MSTGTSIALRNVEVDGSIEDTMATRRSKPRKDIAESYNEVKSFKGQQYTGMKIGRTHKWYYDQGEWREKKVTPDLWQFTYAVTKRRAGRAPEGSGVPVGTEYDWYIAAHQNVKKLNANDYSTSLVGLKYKVSHKRADTEKWSASDNARRKRLVKFLRELIESIEKGEDTGEVAPNMEAIEAAKPRARAPRPKRKAAAKKLPTRRQRTRATTA